VEEIRSKLPELPEARRDRFVTEYGLPLYDANLLTSSKITADYFEACMIRPPQSFSPKKHAKQVANWIIGEFSHLLNVTNTVTKDMGEKVSPVALFDLVQLISQGVISGSSAKLVFEEMFKTGRSAKDIVTEQGLSQISDTGEIEEVVGQVVDANPKAVADYKAGKAQSLTFLVGQVMRVTKGRANPKLVNEQLKKRLEEG
jgi:aspartyl-tRNA(Asn)/glutamyl-tRNA(Gln) amidotransferase subunit B